MSHTPTQPRGAGADPDRRARHERDQSIFHTLLDRHDLITREVTEIPGGIRARTTSADPDTARLIRDHTHNMHKRLVEGFGLRFWDPAFAEIFAQKDKVRMTVTLLDDGVEIEEISDDPNVTTLIRAHGAVVTGFVQHGRKVAGGPSPLPDSYRRVLR